MDETARGCCPVLVRELQEEDPKIRPLIRPTTVCTLHPIKLIGSYMFTNSYAYDLVHSNPSSTVQ